MVVFTEYRISVFFVILNDLVSISDWASNRWAFLKSGDRPAHIDPPEPIAGSLIWRNSSNAMTACIHVFKLRLFHYPVDFFNSHLETRLTPS